MSKSQFRRWLPWCGGLALLWTACRPPSIADSPRETAEPLGACTPALRGPKALFPDGQGHKLLVVDLSGSEPSAAALGHERAVFFSRELARYVHRSHATFDPASNLRSDELRLRYVPCAVTSEAQAHEIGQAWGADSLLWGTVVGGHGAEPAQLSLQLSAVRYRGEVMRPAAGRRSDPGYVPDLAFPALPAADPAPLYPSVLAVHAYRLQRYRLLAAVLQPLLSSPSPSLPPGLRSLYGQAQIITAQPTAGLATLQQVQGQCAAGDHICGALALSHLASAYSVISDGKNALSYAEQATTAARLSPDRALEAELLNQQGDVLYQFSQFQAADEHYQQALALAQAQGDVPGQIQALINLAASDSYRRIDRGPSWAKEALRLAQQHGNPYLLAKAHLMLGTAYSWAGESAAAREEYQQALSLWQRLEDHGGQQLTLRLLSSVPPTEPRSRTDADDLQLSLRLAQQMGDVAAEARLLVLLAREARQHKDWRGAADLLGRANAQWERLGSLSGQASVRMPQANLHYSQGQEAQARAVLEQGLALAERAGIPRLQATLLHDLGNLQTEGRDLSRGFDSCERSVGILRPLPDAYGVAQGLACLGRVHELRGERDKARVQYEQAFVAARKGGAAHAAEEFLASCTRLLPEGSDEAARIAYRDRLYFGETPPKTVLWADLQSTQVADAATPHLPESIKEQLSCATVSLRYRLCVKPDGSVDNISALQSLPQADSQIIKTLQGWRFAARDSVACAPLLFTFVIDPESRRCPLRRKHWNFVAPQIVSALRTDTRGPVPWPLSPPLTTGEARTAVYRACYGGDGRIIEVTPQRGLGAGDAAVLAHLREGRIQPIGLPIC
ncbi:MAG TPA: tetratricopeptide repeat protein, partial [Pseudomonadota bacterium]|nr:tetratricopeptide repeat protein [Pseudomonadota bacterium]